MPEIRYLKHRYTVLAVYYKRASCQWLMLIISQSQIFIFEKHFVVNSNHNKKYQSSKYYMKYVNYVVGTALEELNMQESKNSKKFNFVVYLG